MTSDVKRWKSALWIVFAVYVGVCCFLTANARPAPDRGPQPQTHHPFPYGERDQEQLLRTSGIRATEALRSGSRDPRLTQRASVSAPRVPKPRTTARPAPPSPTQPRVPAPAPRGEVRR
jgi:hypothetical protein